MHSDQLTSAIDVQFEIVDVTVEVLFYSDVDLTLTWVGMLLSLSSLMNGVVEGTSD